MEKLHIISFLIFTSYNCWSQSLPNPLGSRNKQMIPPSNGRIDTIFRPQTVQTSYTSSNWIYASDSISKNAKWEFQIQMNFAPSTDNYLKIYLNSNNYNLTTPLNGYFVQFGEEGQQDNYDLYRQDGLLVTKILNLPKQAHPASDTLSLQLKITRDSLGTWRLWQSSPDKDNYVLKGSAIDSTYTNAEHFGLVTYFTRNNAGEFYSDDLYVNFLEDSLPPRLLAVETLDSTHISVLFDETPGFHSALNSENYHLKDAGTPLDAMADSVYPNKIILSLPKSLKNGNNLLTVQNIKDIYGHTMLLPDSIAFHYQKPYTAKPGDIVINEIFADPTPILGLPNAEFIELHNTTDITIYLENWKFADASSSEIFETDSIQAGEYLIVCNKNDSVSFASFGKVVALEKLPGLNNDGDSLKLISNTGKVIDWANYQPYWFRGIESGGRTLERIDPLSLCKGAENWQASSDSLGGTPGIINKAISSGTDTIPLRVDSIKVTGKSELEIVFNKYVDEISSIDTSFYSVNEYIQSPASISVTDYKPYTLKLDFDKFFVKGYLYKLNISLSDCKGNAVENVPLDFVFPKTDSIAPEFLSLRVIDSMQLKLVFNEPLDSVTLNTGKFHLSNGMGKPDSIFLSAEGDEITLLLHQALLTADYQLTVQPVSDTATNFTDTLAIGFKYIKPYDAQPGEIVINEIFANFSPSHGLPEVEFVELYNNTDITIYLGNWKFADASSAGTFVADSIQAKEYLIVCSRDDSAAFSTYGRVIALDGFPSLNNPGDSLKLISNAGTAIDWANYQKSWYKNPEKEDGGWSLEKIDPTSTCHGAAIWTASLDSLGATPGTSNSVFVENYDEIRPKASLLAYSPNSVTIYINKFIPENLLIDTANYVWASHTPFSVDYRLKDSLLLSLSPKSPLKYGKHYQIHFKNLSDCAGNALTDTLSFYLPFPPGSDSIPPQLAGLTVESPMKISLTFNEKVQAADNTTAIFKLLPSNPIDTVIFQDSGEVDILLRDSLKTGNHTFILNNISDEAGNLLERDSLAFYYQLPYHAQQGDVIFNEIMSAPDSSATNLPDKEFIELFNNTDTTIYLKDWTLWAGTEKETFGDKSIAPGGYLIVCDDSTAFENVENLLIVPKLPSLNNNGDELKLYNRSGELIDSLNYRDYWYRGASSSGRTLERIDPNSTCNSSENWKASTDSTGGTPDNINSVFADGTDNIVLRIDSIQVTDSDELQISFNKYVDEVSATNTSLYSVNGLIGAPVSIYVTTYKPYTLKLGFDKAFAKGNSYKLNVSLSDCKGNPVTNTPLDFVFPKTDSIAPEFLSLTVVDSMQVKLFFSEPLDSATLNTGKFHLSNGMGKPDSIFLSAEGDEITLFLRQSLLTANYQLTVAPLSDTAANFTDTLAIDFKYIKPYDAKFGDIVINEIFADPTPIVGLPNAEFIELFNTSDVTIYLERWGFADANDTAYFGADSIQAGEYLIVCDKDDSTGFAPFGRIITLESMPGLNNDDDSLKLISNMGAIIDWANYQKSWYKNSEKDGGGWSLERIDANSVCMGEAIWAASIDTIGATPGSQNSVFVNNYDQLKPQSSLLENSANKVRFALNKYVLASLIDDTANYQILPDMNGIASVEYQKDSLFVALNFEKPLVYGKYHQIQFKNISDCAGNPLADTLSFYLPFPPGSDSIPPQLVGLTVETPLNIRLNFNENVQAADDAALLFEILPSGPIDTVIFRDSENVDIFLQDSLKTENYTLIVNNISDEAGNLLDSDSISFYYKTPYYAKYGDLLFSEIMANPDSSVSEMPDVEYIEIYNNSDSIISLKNWTLHDRSKDGIIDNKTINPGEYVILCAEEYSALLSQYGKTITVSSFPRPNNGDDSYRLYNSVGTLIDSISYSDDWYRDSEKKKGGWSLENTALQSTCPGVFKWYASLATKGGTPGEANSQPPGFTATDFEVTDNTQLQLTFSRMPANGNILGRYTINNGASLAKVTVMDSINATLLLKMSEPLQTGILYRLSFNNLSDCAGQLLSDSVYFEFLIPDQAAQNDLVINEILFNARTGGMDYLEIYNNSQKILDLKNIRLSYISGSGATKKSLYLSDNTLLIHPQEYKLFSSNPLMVRNQYDSPNPMAFAKVDGFPDFTQSSGSVSLYESNVLIDSLHYDKNMHNTFISDPDGISLEKTQFDLPTNQAGSFHSASADVGYGTPGYQNSQFIQSLAAPENVSLEHQLFSPDNDGFQDKLKINYQFNQAGYVGNITVFDTQGRIVRQLFKNQSLSTKGTINWDGKANNLSLLNSGAYIIFIEIFSERGLFKKYKLPCVLALSDL